MRRNESVWRFLVRRVNQYTAHAYIVYQVFMTHFFSFRTLFPHAYNFCRLSQHSSNSFTRTKIVYFDTKRPKRVIGALRVWNCRKNPRPKPTGRGRGFLQMHAKPALAHRLQTLKMHRNSTSLNSCQHDDINIVTVSVARRRWTARSKPHSENFSGKFSIKI